MLYQSQSVSHGMCNAVWDRFEMANVQLSYNCWFSSLASSLFKWHPMQKGSTKVDLIYNFKKYLGRGNFVLFSKLFPHFGEHYIVVTLNKILATTYTQVYLHIVFYFHTISISFHSVCTQIKHEIFSQKIQIVFHDHWTWNQKRVTQRNFKS